jgi:glycogen phosphorylase
MSKYGLYSPGKVYETNGALRKAMERLIDGPMKGLFSNIYQSLLYHDNYYVLQDFESYANTHAQAIQAYNDKAGWAGKCMMNTAMSGYFSSDRAVDEYNEQIWKLKKVEE